MAVHTIKGKKEPCCINKLLYFARVFCDASLLYSSQKISKSIVYKPTVKSYDTTLFCCLFWRVSVGIVTFLPCILDVHFILHASEKKRFTYNIH